MRVRRWVVLFAACVLLAAAPTAAQASAGQAPNDKRPPFVVTGHVRPVTFREAASNKSLRWFADAQTILEIPDPAYYVADSTMVDGSPAFDFWPGGDER